MVESKIIGFESMVRRAEGLRRDGTKIVLCHGLFNSLHIGHMRYLREARNQGDIIIVSVIADKDVAKGDQVLFSEDLRAESVASLGWVDFVVINPYSDIASLVERLRPGVFVKGFESAREDAVVPDREDPELLQLKSMGVEVVIARENDYSSTSRINQYLSGLPEEIHQYLHLFKQRHSFRQLQETIAAMQKLKVLVIGDTILDEYQYCEAIGKSSKDPTLALKYENHDLFAGGVLAVANHVAGFAGSVDLVTVLGENDSHEAFVRAHLHEAIRPFILNKPNAPTLIKRRFIDSYSMNKLLEVYVMDDSGLIGETEKRFISMVRERLPHCELVIVADFGHGTINGNLKKVLSDQAPYLAVNAQSNAGNRGFNNVSKYPRADYVSIAEHELRLEQRDLTGKLWPMVHALAENLSCRKFTVTRGRKGCLVHDRDGGGFVQIPTFARNVVDRVGAGDALFAVTSLAAAIDAHSEVLGFLGNAAGSLAVETMGNQEPIDKLSMIPYLEALLENI